MTEATTGATMTDTHDGTTGEPSGDDAERARWALPAAGARDLERMTELVERLIAGDLTARCGLTGRTPRGRLGEALDRLAEHLGSSVTVLTGASTLLESGGEELFMASVGLSDATEQAGTMSSLIKSSTSSVVQHVGSVSDGVEALTSNARRLHELAGSSSAAAQDAAEQARGSVELGDRLQASAQAVSDVVGVISKIAAQTKLLALNAAIESARAGDAGLGFGVVANEVKRLAQQTQEATDTITSRIGQIVTDSEDASRAFRGISEVIEVAQSHQAATAEAIGEQASLTADVAAAGRSAGEAGSEIGASLEASDAALATAAAAGAGVQDLAMRLIGLASELQRVTASSGG